MAAPLYATGFPLELFSFPQQESKVVLDYIYVDQTRIRIRNKVRVVDFEPQKPEDCPLWEYNMFNEFRESSIRPEKHIRPVAIFKDPFRKGNNKVVLCEFLDLDKSPSVINTRAPCDAIMTTLREEEPWFGLEQEYFITDYDGRPLGWEMRDDFFAKNRHAQQGMSRTIGFERRFAETHLQACIYAGLKVAGMNREEAPGQWEYQIGPCCGTEAGDQLVVSRFILMRLAELFGVEVTFKMKPVPESSMSSGLHINFSTKKMRQEGGLKYIEEAIEKLRRTKQENLLKYYDLNEGKDNDKRLGGWFSPPKEFKHGVADKFASIRIPPQVFEKKCGYFEERRPGSDSDPYAAIGALTKVVCL